MVQLKQKRLLKQQISRIIRDIKYERDVIRLVNHGSLRLKKGEFTLKNFDECETTINEFDVIRYLKEQLLCERIADKSMVEVVESICDKGLGSKLCAVPLSSGKSIVVYEKRQYIDVNVHFIYRKYHFIFAIQYQNFLTVPVKSRFEVLMEMLDYLFELTDEELFELIQSREVRYCFEIE